MTDRQSPTEFFVAAAVVVGELVDVMNTARELSLAAKNAKAIAGRAGTRAAGFRPITEFIDAMGNETRELVLQINRCALSMSRNAVAEARIEGECRRLAAARRQMTTACPEVEALQRAVDARLALQRERMRDDLRTLVDLLETIAHRMRAARVISTRSRVEATHAGDYQTNLKLVADVVENAAEKIRVAVSGCIDCLRHAA
ncbi:MAG: chemotaxis protein [Gammaproteobacteria bacterium]